MKRVGGGLILILRERSQQSFTTNHALGARAGQERGEREREASFSCVSSPFARGKFTLLSSQSDPWCCVIRIAYIPTDIIIH